jgi:hypothetical protein
MPDMDERVIRLEERVDAHMQILEHLSIEMSALRNSMDAGFSSVRAEIAALREREDTRFTWMIGIMVAGFLTMFGTIAGVYWQLLQNAR